jgi:hypothetical protein
VPTEKESTTDKYYAKGEKKMPYEMKKVDGKYKVVNKETGKVHAKATSKKKAQAQMRLLHGVDTGWKPTGKKKKG